MFDHLEEMVPRVQELEKELEAANEKIERLKAELKLHQQGADGNYWVWQGDNNDYPESLTCPVLMPAEEVRKWITENAMLRRHRSELRLACNPLYLAHFDDNYASPIIDYEFIDRELSRLDIEIRRLTELNAGLCREYETVRKANDEIKVALRAQSE